MFTDDETKPRNITEEDFLEVAHMIQQLREDNEILKERVRSLEDGATITTNNLHKLQRDSDSVLRELTTTSATSDPWAGPEDAHLESMRKEIMSSMKVPSEYLDKGILPTMDEDALKKTALFYGVDPSPRFIMPPEDMKDE